MDCSFIRELKKKSYYSHYKSKRQRDCLIKKSEHCIRLEEKPRSMVGNEQQQISAINDAHELFFENILSKIQNLLKK